MKILLTNHFIGGLTGSETWVYTMEKELKRLGHKVEIYTAGSYKEVDAGALIINHNTCLQELTHIKKPKIFTCHGIIPALEQPVKGANKYVSVSEEVQEHLKNRGFESIVIRNGIDCDKYKKTKEPNEQIKNVLFLSNYQGNALPIIKQACDELGLNLKVYGKDNRIEDVVGAINEADLVFALGRTAYEAMACERNVIIYDYNGGDGFCTPESLLEFRKNNCSGRRYKINYSVEELKKEILKYNKENGKKLREYILENNNIKNTVKDYLNAISESMV